MNINQLKGFIAVKNVENIADLKKYLGSMKLSKWPNKESVDEAINGNLNLIKLAFDSRNNSNKLKLKSFNSMFPHVAEDQVHFPLVKEMSLGTEEKNEVKLNEDKFLKNESWRNDVWMFVDDMDVHDPNAKHRITDDYDSELAVELNSTLLVRLEKLIDSRVQNAKKKHWGWDFVRDNLITMSCVIVLQQHVNNIDLVKLAQTNVNACVLDEPSNKFTRHVESSVAEGCYIFYDRVKKEWIRSGKCTGRPTQKRIE